VILAWFYAAIPVGSAIGYMFGGAVGAAWGWRTPFHLAAVPGLLLAAVCLFFKDRRPGLPKTKPVHRMSDYLGLLRIPSYSLNVAAQTAMTFAIGGMSAWAPTYFYQDRGQHDLGEVGVVFGGITAVAGLLATLLGGWLADRLAVRHGGAYFLVSGAGMLLAFPCTVAMLYAPFPLAWAFCFLSVFFLFFNIGPANTAIANVTAPRLRGTAYAVNIFVIHAFGDAISPPLIGAIADRSSLQAGFLVVSVMMLAAGLIWLGSARFLARDMARVHETGTEFRANLLRGNCGKS
jgi:MFS family permease